MADDSKSTRFYSETDLPMAKDDIVVTQIIEHGVEVQRKLFAGQRVPPDLIGPFEAATSSPKKAAPSK